jgi:hypothetical protein
MLHLPGAHYDSRATALLTTSPVAYMNVPSEEQFSAGKPLGPG